jgi:hypothetical protein
MAALQAHAQVHPGITNLETLFAALCVGLDFLHVVFDVGA